jgi:hypothetical protein
MKALIIAVAFALLAASSASAAVVSYTFSVYLAPADPVAGAPTATTSIPLAAWTCNLPQPVIPPGQIVNPRFLWIDDPDPTHPGKACSIDQNTFFTPLAAGTYTASIQAVDDVGQVSTPRSLLVNTPFLRQPPPAVPTGLRFGR